MLLSQMMSKDDLYRAMYNGGSPFQLHDFSHVAFDAVNGPSEDYSHIEDIRFEKSDKMEYYKFPEVPDLPEDLELRIEGETDPEFFQSKGRLKKSKVYTPVYARSEGEPVPINLLILLEKYSGRKVKPETITEIYQAGHYMKFVMADGATSEIYSGPTPPVYKSEAPELKDGENILDFLIDNYGMVSNDCITEKIIHDHFRTEYRMKSGSSFVFANNRVIEHEIVGNGHIGRPDSDKAVHMVSEPYHREEYDKNGNKLTFKREKSTALLGILKRSLSWHKEEARDADKERYSYVSGNFQHRLQNYFDSLINDSPNTEYGVDIDDDFAPLISNLYRHYRSQNNYISESWNNQFVERITKLIKKYENDPESFRKLCNSTFRKCEELFMI